MKKRRRFTGLVDANGRWFLSGNTSIVDDYAN